MAYKKGVKGTKYNKHGVKFTASEQKELKKLVNQANKLAKVMESKQPKIKQNRNENLGKHQSNWLYKKKTANLNNASNFKTEKEKKAYMKGLRDLTSGRYVNRIEKQYFENYKSSILVKYGNYIGNDNYSHTEESRALFKQLDSLGRKEFIKRMDSGTITPIGEFYIPQENDDDFYDLIMEELS